jgi:hypothetical protein
VVEGGLVRGHQVGALHPGDEGQDPLQLGQVQQVLVEGHVAELLEPVGHVLDQLVGGQAGEVGLLGGDHGHAALAGLGLGGQPVVEGAAVQGHEADRPVEAGQDPVAERLGLGGRPELGREHDHAPFLGVLGAGPESGRQPGRPGQAGAEAQEPAPRHRSRHAASRPPGAVAWWPGCSFA